MNERTPEQDQEIMRRYEEHRRRRGRDGEEMRDHQEVEIAMAHFDLEHPDATAEERLYALATAIDAVEKRTLDRMGPVDDPDLLP